MAKSALNRSAAIVIATQLVVSACDPLQLYDGPERRPDETALLNIKATDCPALIRAQIDSVDGQSVYAFPQSSVLPGPHTVRAHWKRRKCPSPGGGGDGGAFRELGWLLLPVALVALPFKLFGREEGPDYGEGTRDFETTLEAGKEYYLGVRGIDGNKVFLWIAEVGTGNIIGGESPRTWRTERIDLEKLKRHADSGDPDAMYQYADQLKIGAGLERLRWYCLAAHQGSKDAQLKLSSYYWNGYDNLPVDLVRAYIWYSLAMEKCAGTPGYCPNEVGRQFLAKEMTPAQIVEAQRLIAEWKPDSAQCEVIGGENRTARAPATGTVKASTATTALSTSPSRASWNGKWFAKDGAWSLYMEVENGVFTGSALRRGSDRYRLAGTILPEYMVTGRIEDEEGAPTGSLSGMFPNVSVSQDGRMQASFNLERRE